MEGERILDKARLPFCKRHSVITIYPLALCSFDLVVNGCQVGPLRCEPRIKSGIGPGKDRTEPSERPQKLKAELVEVETKAPRRINPVPEDQPCKVDKCGDPD